MAISKRSSSFDPIKRPGLAYQYAFNWLAAHLAKSEPGACSVSSVFCGSEMLHRLPNLAFLAPIPNGMETSAEALGCKPLQTTSLGANKFMAVAWLEPSLDDLERLDDLAQTLSLGGHLYLLVSGPLARFLAERRTSNNSQATFLNVQVAMQALSRHGFRMKGRLAWHGPRAIAWHYLGQAAMYIGKPSWSDRCHFAMRRDLSERGPLWHLTALSCLAAERIK